MTTYNTTIGQRIKAAREAANLTQAQMAIKLGYGRPGWSTVASGAQHLSNIECGQYNPSMRTIAAINRALRIKLVK